MMPGMDGIEVCQRLRRQPEHAGLPILLLTALEPAARTRRAASRPGRTTSCPSRSTRSSCRPGLRSLLRTKALQDRLADLLGRYVSESVAAEVLRDPFAVSLGGDRRHVSTLFADIRGYTALAARASARGDARPAQPLPDRRQRRRRDHGRHRRRPARRRRLRVLRGAGHALRRPRARGPRRARRPGRGAAPRDPVDAGRATADRDRHHERRGHRRQHRLRAPDALRGRRGLASTSRPGCRRPPVRARSSSTRRPTTR